MPSPLLVHNDAEPLVAFLLWCLAIHRARTGTQAQDALSAGPVG
jgi:hypothetical protein